MPAKIVALLWGNFGPYHRARLRAVQEYGAPRGWQALGLELAGASATYAWETPERCGDIVTLFPQAREADVSPWAYLQQTWLVLQRLQPQALAICGYDHPAMLTALVWSLLHKKIAVFMSESKADDQPRQAWKEWGKRRIVRRFAGALVGGAPQQEYAVSLGLPPERVFPGYDVVDNDYYWQGAQAVRQAEAVVRARLGLPRPYFLNVSRFIEKKNLFRLLQAYGIYRQAASKEPWDLVLCGSGPLEAALKQAAAAFPGVHFPGFKQADELPAYYGLASAFIIPSSHFEQWGLVVNEAMASGLPVLVSRACGCARDLVQEGVNGFTFDPYDVAGLARLMIKMSSGQVDLQAMGAASRRIIAQWTPQVFARNLFRVIEAARSH
ncbi:MAG: glycosyltransferase family 4 protein [Desulfobacca sp.]|uniref:glycosyltransferase family 4 protein n=1 Tax=Desulfobacca sp. TaxID=2067990 RepID=UPI004049CF08